MTWRTPTLREIAFAWASRTADIQGLEWVLDALKAPEASTDQRKQSLILATRPTASLWAAIEELDGNLLDAYWKRMNPWGVLNNDVEHAARELVARDRAWSAIDMLTMALHGADEGTERLTPELVLEVLDAATRSDPHKSASKHPDTRSESYSITSRRPVRRSDPWLQLVHLLRLLDHVRQPRALYEELSNSSSTFVKLVSRVYRRKNEPRKDATEQGPLSPNTRGGCFTVGARFPVSRKIDVSMLNI